MVLFQTITKAIEINPNYADAYNNSRQSLNMF